MSWQILLSVALFFSTFALFLWGKFSHSVVAMAVASCFIVLRFVPLHDVFSVAVDWEVIFLLLSMMIIVDIVRDTGALQYLAIKLAKMVRGYPPAVFLLFSLLIALVSAFLDNVTSILIFAPLAVLLCKELSINPVPLLLNMTFFSNIGGASTLIGDPPNIIIGLTRALTFNDFLINLAPLTLFILFCMSGVLYPILVRKIRASPSRMARIMAFEEDKLISNRGEFIRSLTILGLVLVGFVIHGWINLSPSAIAFTGASFLLLTVPKESALKYFRHIDWETIFFLIALFIIVYGLKSLGILSTISEYAFAYAQQESASLLLTVLWISGLLSAMIDNIPAVTVLLPILSNLTTDQSLTLSHPDGIWWALALGTCLGGNGTLLGSSANVAMSSVARDVGHPISFALFSKYGIVVTLFSLITSSFYLIWMYT